MVGSFIVIAVICLGCLVFYPKLWKAMDTGLAMAQKKGDKQYTFLDDKGEQEHLPMVAETDKELDEEGFWQ